MSEGETQQKIDEAHAALDDARRTAKQARKWWFFAGGLVGLALVIDLARASGARRSR